MSLQANINARLPLAFGISGPLATPLLSASKVQHTVETAIEQGVTLFDTAPAYGNGDAERRLGRAIGAEEDIFISTKAGLSSSGLRHRTRDFSPDSIERSIDQSIERLGRAIDLLWMHGAAPEELTNALLTRLSTRLKDGSVRYLGLAGRGAEVEAGLDRGPFSAVMLPVHAGLGDEATKRVAALKASGAVVFAIEVMSPSLGQGHGVSAGALWRLGRKTLRSTPEVPKSARLAPDEALQWALREGGADVAVTTTTRLDRLRSNITVVRTMAASH